MGRMLVAAFLVAVVAPSLNAQERHAWFVGAGLGPVRQDRQGNELLHRDGNFYQIHGGLQLGRHLGARLDLVHASVGRNDDIVFAMVPCPDPPAGCAAPFLGPVHVTGLSTGLEGSWIDRRLLLLGSVGPGVYWLTDRPPGTRGFTAGVRVGIGAGYQLAPRLWAVLDLQYHRLFTDGRSPRWLIPGSIGLEVR
jgi:outer membrane protein with beta-barrel domain